MNTRLVRAFMSDRERSSERPVRNPFEPSFEQLPETLPIFPLSGVLLLPGGKLPLNIFEPRYLAMISDALAGSRMIGMVQPLQPGGFAGDGVPSEDGPPKVHRVGCAGRITNFNETEDGRLMLVLSGVCRFDIVRELDLAQGGYRRVSSVFSPYRADLDHADDVVELDRERLMAALAAFFRGRQLSTDWDAVNKAGDENLVTSLSMVLPFGPAEKQALLEAADLKTRAETLIAITEMTLAQDRDDFVSSLQ
jgi:Lon protease-like protein